MIRSIDDFKALWRRESESTGRVMAQLTDASLDQRVAQDYRTLGRLAWHVVGSIPDTMRRTGLPVKGPGLEDAVPATARAIADAYDIASGSLLQEICAWRDEDLETVDDMFGERWERRETLLMVVNHEIHHRGQMTVLMRQAGLEVPGVYGPARQDWAQWNMEPPKI